LQLNFTSLPVVSVYSDIVKLTAQFVARNGRQFLTNLMSREQASQVTSLSIWQFKQYISVAPVSINFCLSHILEELSI
jgi:hypothetical protein